MFLAAFGEFLDYSIIVHSMTLINVNIVSFRFAALYYSFILVDRRSPT
jgi:hypothetical protein